MAFPLLVVFGFITKPPTMIRLFAELFGHYHSSQSGKRFDVAAAVAAENSESRFGSSAKPKEGREISAAPAAEDSHIAIDSREVGSAVPADRFGAHAFPQFPNRGHHGFHG
jgi:hypothetical protein